MAVMSAHDVGSDFWWWWWLGVSGASVRRPVVEASLALDCRTLDSPKPTLNRGGLSNAGHPFKMNWSGRVTLSSPKAAVRGTCVQSWGAVLGGRWVLGYTSPHAGPRRFAWELTEYSSSKRFLWLRKMENSEMNLELCFGSFRSVRIPLPPQLPRRCCCEPCSVQYGFNGHGDH